MAIPNITFNISTEGLGSASDAIEKVPGLVLTGVTENNVVLGQSYQIFSLNDAINLGITEASLNAFAYKHIKAFYTEASDGVMLWFLLVSDATLASDMVSKTNPYAKKLIEEAKDIRVLGILKKALDSDTIADGFDADLALTVLNAQALVDHFTEKYYPFKCILSGNSFTGTVQDLKDFSDANYKDINVLMANDDGAPEGAIGLCLGRQASIPSQRRQSRVKDGTVIDLNAYFTNGEKVETLIDAWDTIDNKRYTFFRNFSNRSGYFFSGERTLVGNENDFSTLAPGFVMNEAMLIAYDVLVEELSDEILFTTDGLIHPAVIKSWQGTIESNITQLMFDTGKISGVKVLIDENQKVATTKTLVIDIQVQPVGYADYIQVNMGLTVNLDE